MASSVLPVRTSGKCAAIEELQELDHEFDVANAAAAGLHVPQVGPFALGPPLDPPLERLDAGDIGEAQVAAIDPGLEPFEQLAAELAVAGDRPGLHVRLPLPGAALRVVIRERAVETQAERAARTLGPQPHVDAVRRAQVGRFGEQANDVLAPAARRTLRW